MPLPVEHMNITYLHDLFYRCKFNQLLSDLKLIESEHGGLNAELVLVRANCLFESHQVTASKSALKEVSKSKDGFDEDYLYALARVCYLDGDCNAARELFREIHTNTQSPEHGFKSLLGIANTYYSQGDYGKIPPLIEQLCAFEPIEKDDERISLLLFLGNYYLASGASSELAKNYFRKALSSASSKTWTYFITRSLYGIAAVCEQQSDRSELLWTLEILRSFVDESEQLFYSYLINDRFKAYFSINTAIEFDTANNRIMIKNRWIPFHDKPMLFRFLLLLKESGSFVTKEQIAEDLWQEESYKPRVHDPRIFDIAKRARKMIEAYENQPVVLLSGRMGYKLASI